MDFRKSFKTQRTFRLSRNKSCSWYRNNLFPIKIAEIAFKAKEAGAEIIVVHGESLVEPVEQGTNEAAIERE